MKLVFVNIKVYFNYTRQVVQKKKMNGIKIKYILKYRFGISNVIILSTSIRYVEYINAIIILLLKIKLFRKSHIILSKIILLVPILPSVSEQLHV